MLLKFLHRLYLACWYGAVTLLIVLAVAVTAARALFPAVDRYRAEIESWAGAQLGAPVTIGAIDARFEGFTPSVVLRAATLRDAAGAALVRFEEARVGLDLMGSLMAREAVLTELTIQGARLELERLADGRWRLRGLDTAGGDTGSAGPLAALLLGHGRLLLRNIELVLADARRPGQAPVVVAERLELRNAGVRHLLEGRIRLHGSGHADDLKLAAEIEGDPLAGDFSGKGYLEGTGITPAPWLTDLLPAGLNFDEGRVDFKLWSDWARGRVTWLGGSAGVAGLRMTGEGGALAADRLQARFEAERSEEGWRAALDDLRLEGQGHALGPLRVRVTEGQGRTDWALSGFPLRESVALSRLVPGLAPAVREQLAAAAPAGELRGVRAVVSDGRLADLRAELEYVTARAAGKIPGVTGLSGRLRWHEGLAELALDSRNGQVDLAALMRDPIPFTELSGRLLARLDQGALTLQAPELRVSNDDVRLQLWFGFEQPAQGPSLLALSGRFQEAQAVAVPKYVPARIMPPKSVAWLDAAFKAGRVPQGSVAFYGAPADFPFDKRPGHFEVRFAAEGVTLHFQEGWPALTDVAGDVLFENRGMLIEGRDGRLFGGKIQSAQVGIENLESATLRVDGRAVLHDNDPLRLLTETPLKSKFAAYVYPKLRLQGDSDLAIKLIIPLESRDPSPLRVSGALDLKGAAVTLADRLTAEKVAGRLLFDESRIYSEQAVTAALLGGPLELKVAHEGEGAATQTRISAAGSATAAGLRHFLDSPLLAQLSGTGQWRGNLVVPHARADGAEGGVRLQIASDLVGFTSALPAPLAKDPGEARAVELTLPLSGARKGQLMLRYADVASALLDLGEGQGLARGIVRFGGTPARLPEGHELVLQGSLEGLDASAWSDLLKAQPGSAAARPRRGQEPIAVTLDMDRLQLKAKPDQKGGETAEEEEPLGEPGPPRRVRVHVRRFAQGPAEYGELTYSSEPRTGVAVQELALAGEAFTLTGHGVVLYQPGAARTELNVDLASEDVGKMMKTLGFASVISSGKLRAKGNLAWAGEFTDFALGRLDGGFHITMHEGRIDEVQPGAGRILGLFSLSALPSRLSLDFRDLFESGLRFNLIDGSFKLTHGNAETGDLRMEANAAAIQLTGRTGLARRDYDQTVAVTPHVADSLPVAGGLAWGPQVGAALLLVQKIFQPQIDAAARSRYRVTGSWEQPVVERISPPAPPPGTVPGGNR